MHSGTVPVRIAERLAMPIYGYSVFFSYSLQQIAGDPSLVSRVFRPFAEHLKFPLGGCNFGIYAVYFYACIEACIQMFIDNFPAESIVRSDRAIILSLR